MKQATTTTEKVSLTDAGIQEVMDRCPSVHCRWRCIREPAIVIARQQDTGDYLLKFPGVKGHIAVPKSSVRQ